MPFGYSSPSKKGDKRKLFNLYDGSCKSSHYISRTLYLRVSCHACLDRLIVLTHNLHARAQDV